LSEHLTPAELRAGSRGELSSERRRAILFHLLEGCASCQGAVGWNQRVRESLGVPEELASQRQSAYDQPVARTFERAIRLKRELEEQRVRAREVATLLDRGELGVSAGTGRLEPAGFGVYEALLDRISSLRHEDPQEMVRLARMAVDVAEALDPATFGDRQVADFQARAWGELGNALRGADDLWEAQAAFERAFDVLERGTGSTALIARLHDLHASLLGTQRRFELAFLALDVVRDLYREIGDSHSVGRVLVKKALYLQYSGRSEEALQVHRQGIAQIDEARDPNLAPNLLQNHVWYLVECRQFREAKRLLFRNRHIRQRAPRVMCLKFLWAEAKARYGLGELASSEALFLEVKKGMEEAGLGFAAALASLEIAMVRMSQGQTAAAETLVIEAAAVFASLGIQREALAAVALLREAFERQKATTLLVERTAAFLRHWENNPDSCFAFRPE
jgi:tetratricopeptide (TPR) repeat protein